jgi:hypothetical protein
MTNENISVFNHLFQVFITSSYQVIAHYMKYLMQKHKLENSGIGEDEIQIY